MNSDCDLTSKTKVYFFAQEGRIKIGFSRNVQRRHRDLTRGNGVNLDVLGVIDGGYHLEHAIHERLAAHRLQGEWFEDCAEVRSTIAEIMRSGPATIGYSSPEKPIKKPAVQPQRTPAESAKLKFSLLSLMWPDDPAGHFADFIEMPVEAVRYWIENPTEAPKLVLIALSQAVAMLVINNKPVETIQNARHRGRVVASVEGDMGIAPDKVGREAVKMLREGKTEAEIVANYFGRYTFAEIEAAIARAREAKIRYRERRKAVEPGVYLCRLGLSIATGPVPPVDVIAEREQRRRLTHIDTTAYLLGDPLPGESMLDKRQPCIASSSIVSDPLDGLVFGRIKAV